MQPMSSQKSVKQKMFIGFFRCAVHQSQHVSFHSMTSSDHSRVKSDHQKPPRAKTQYNARWIRTPRQRLGQSRPYCEVAESVSPLSTTTRTTNHNHNQPQPTHQPTHQPAIHSTTSSWGLLATISFVPSRLLLQISPQHPPLPGEMSAAVVLFLYGSMEMAAQWWCWWSARCMVTLRGDGLPAIGLPWFILVLVLILGSWYRLIHWLTCVFLASCRHELTEGYFHHCSYHGNLLGWRCRRMILGTA